MFKHILAATDGSDLSSAAVATAARLARSLGAKLTLVNVREPFVPAYTDWSGFAPMIDPDVFDKAALAASEKTLVAAKALAAVEKVDCDIASITALAPWRGILECAKEYGCDAIVMASHGRHGIGALVLGSETQKVLTHSTLPVLVTR